MYRYYTCSNKAPAGQDGLAEGRLDPDRPPSATSISGAEPPGRTRASARAAGDHPSQRSSTAARSVPSAAAILLRDMERAKMRVAPPTEYHFFEQVARVV